MPTVTSALRSAFFLLRSRDQPLGVRGELAAARYLRGKGYTIVAGGRRGRFGEIDLIAVWRKEVVVFVEVKTRRSRWAGGPEDAVGPDQKRRIVRSALEFLKANGLLEYPARFDIVAVVWPKDAKHPASIEHFENAFEPDDRGQFFS